MKAAFTKLFLNNWQRKFISVILAVVIWLLVNHTLTTTRTISNIPVRIINIPAGKTIDGLQNNGLLSKRITLTLAGNQTMLDELSSNDLEVVIDAADKQDEWIVSISKKNLVSLNPDVDIYKGISRVSHQSFIIRMTKLVTEKIPVMITQPIGQSPRDYQYLDVWPYQLTLTISGPEEVVKHLKAKGIKLTFNLNNISKAQLDALTSKSNDEVSYYVPDPWKQVSIPLLSDSPIEINDPQAKALRIDFVRSNLMPIENPIPVMLYFPPEYVSSLNPETVHLISSPLVKEINGVNMITEQLFAKGVDRLFIHIVRDMLQISVIVTPQNMQNTLNWSVQFMNPRMLEDRYVSTLMSDVSDEEIRDLQPNLREEYLRNRFRSYMNRFQFFKGSDTKLELNVELRDSQVLITETNSVPKQ